MLDQPILQKSPVFTDSRGAFFPLSLSSRWLQSNVSVNPKKNTFRGLHHQRGETAQSKLVTVVQGSIIDLLVNLNEDHFGQVYKFIMRAGDQLYVPKGFAHSFLTLEDNTIVQYLVDNTYSPKTEISFDWKSVHGVKMIVSENVPDSSELLLSPKDAQGILLTREFAESIDYYELKTLRDTVI